MVWPHLLCGCAVKTLVERLKACDEDDPHRGAAAAGTQRRACCASCGLVYLIFRL